MTNNRKMRHLVKGLSLSSMLFLLAACQDVTAQTAEELPSRSVHSSVEKVPKKETYSDVSLRFEVERKATNHSVPNKTETKVEEKEPAAIVQEPVMEVAPKINEEKSVKEAEVKTGGEKLSTPEIKEPVTLKPIEETPPPTEEAIPEEHRSEGKQEDATQVGEEETKTNEQPAEPVYTYEPSYETSEIPYETLYVLNDDMDNDKIQTLKEGKAGEMTQTWLHTFKDGKWESKHVTKTAVLDPIPEIVMVGTKIVKIPKKLDFRERKSSDSGFATRSRFFGIGFLTTGEHLENKRKTHR